MNPGRLRGWAELVGFQCTQEALGDPGEEADHLRPVCLGWELGAGLGLRERGKQRGLNDDAGPSCSPLSPDLQYFQFRTQPCPRGLNVTQSQPSRQGLRSVQPGPGSEGGWGAPC